MREALAARNMRVVFRILQYRTGMSQRGIAERTGQSQSEISEVMGGRHIVSYDVLVRIAEGLGIPRGYLGLAYVDTEASATLKAGRRAVCPHCATARSVIGTWTGVEIGALRLAKRMTVRGFAAFLGVSDRMVSKWEVGGAAISPRPVNQAALDTALAQCDDETADRFTAALVSRRAVVRLCADNRGRAATQL
jgi:transcriptional regulator with XRE-family HTH domain